MHLINAIGCKTAIHYHHESKLGSMSILTRCKNDIGKFSFFADFCQCNSRHGIPAIITFYTTRSMLLLLMKNIEILSKCTIKN